MTVLDAPTPTAAHPTPTLHVSDKFPALLARLDGIADLVRDSAARGEELGEPTPEVVQALHDIGVFKVAVPVELGGYEFSPRQLLAVGQKLASFDASTGWVFVAIDVAMASTAGYIDEATAQAYFGDGRTTLMTGQGTRLGSATKVDGGYRVSGSWQFNSGAPLADVIHTAVIGDDGRPMVATLPVSDVTTVDNWDVMGLRATGSHDYRIDDVFVADIACYDVDTRTRRRGGAFYTLGLANIATLHHGGWALGVAERLLAEMRTVTVTKSQRPGDSVTTDQFFAEYADAEVSYRSARAFMHEVWADNEATLAVGGTLTAEQETLTRLATHNAKWTAQAIALTVYRWSGTAALRDGDIQRYFRDIHAGVQHISCSPGVKQSAGKHLVGSAPGSSWLFYQLLTPPAPDAA